MGSAPAQSQQPNLQAALGKPQQDARRAGEQEETPLTASPCCNLLNPSGAPLSRFLEMPISRVSLLEKVREFTRAFHVKGAWKKRKGNVYFQL